MIEDAAVLADDMAAAGVQRLIECGIAQGGDTGVEGGTLADPWRLLCHGGRRQCDGHGDAAPDFDGGGAFHPDALLQHVAGMAHWG